MKQILKLTMFLAAMAFVASCENNDIITDGGTFPETGGIDLTLGVLRSANYAEDNPLLEMDHKNVSDECMLTLTKPAEQTITYTVGIDKTLVGAYNGKNGTNYTPFPGDVILTNEQLKLEKGKQESSKAHLEFTYDKNLASAIYLLPLIVKGTSSNPAVSDSYQTIYYRINVWDEFAPAEYTTEPLVFTHIGYIDTENMNPLIANKLFYKLGREPHLSYVHAFSVINLLTATVKYDQSGSMPEISYNKDISYVLGHAKKYIMPLQAQGHKVCLTIKGDGQGIGFSNLNATQSQKLVYDIRKCLEIYGLDGVNLYDEDFSYKKEGDNLPSAANLCNFVTALRQAIDDKLITYAMTEESASGLDQSQNGIELGKIVDYAWTNQFNRLVNPWREDNPFGDDSQWKIAGLEQTKFGALTSTLKSLSQEEGELMEGSIFDNILDAGYMDLANVFVVNSIAKVVAGVETQGATYLLWGALINYDVLQGINPELVPGLGKGGYLDIHSDLCPKDW
ncbi:BT_3987 domain-containing protein [Bacteroides faecium]|uniref:DUF1735 domain-containing protein n=1 Tax=Bacteroides faecium TaxID=2715212 RepID=A0A6H0KVH8_9BACE|nr:DUF1735 domain-containing protein [Bacteroides faecium]QIU96478.1 DUF1735 domain-containing protein [Bacteroides faecium]